MGKHKGKIEKIAIILFMALIFGYLAIVVLNNSNKLGFGDWDVKYAKAFTNIESIVKYRQFPVWNPYHCGGISQLGDSTNDYLSPMFIFNIIFGPNIGYRIIFIVYLIIGFISFNKLGQYLGLSSGSSVFSSILFVFSGLFFQAFATGMPEFMPLTMLPLFLSYYFEALKTHSLKTIIKSAIVLTLIIFGGYHYLPIITIFILVIMIINIIINKTLRPLIITAIFFTIFLLLISIKLLPVLEQTQKYPRFITEQTSGFSVKSISNALLSRKQNHEAFPNWGDYKKQSLIDGLSYSLGENGMYIGIIPFILIIIGLFSKNKNKKLMSILLIVFIYMSFGLNINPSLYKLLSNLPIFNNLRVAQRYRYFFIISLVFFSGLGLDRIVSGFAKKIPYKNIIYFMIIISITIDLVVVNSQLIKKTFSLPLIKIKKTGNFIQSRGNLYYNKNGFTENLSLYTSNSSEYPYLLAGYGVAGYCYEARTIKPNNSLIESPTYNGEYYLINNNGKTKIIKWTPNILLFQVDIQKQDTLVVNQTFDYGWKVSSGGKSKPKIINSNKLIGVELQPGRYQIKLYYQPLSLIIGMLTTTLSIIIVIIFFLYI